MSRAAVAGTRIVLVLVSGGGSANWIAPIGGLTIGNKQALTKTLLASGAPSGVSSTRSATPASPKLEGGTRSRSGKYMSLRWAMKAATATAA